MDVGTIHSQLPFDGAAYGIVDTDKRLNVGDSRYTGGQIYCNNLAGYSGDSGLQQLCGTQISSPVSIVDSDVNKVSDKEERLIGSILYTDKCLPSNHDVSPVLPSASVPHIQVNSWLDKGNGKIDSYPSFPLYVPTVDGSSFVDRPYWEGCPNTIAGTSGNEGDGHTYTSCHDAHQTPIMATRDHGVIHLLDFDAGIMAHATSENPVQQFSLTDMSQQPRHGGAVLAEPSITYADKGHQGCQMANAYVSATRVLDFVEGVAAPVPVRVKSQHFSLRGLPSQLGQGRCSNVQPRCGRPSDVAAIPLPLSGGRITSLHPMSAAPHNTESPSDAATSASNNGCSRATGTTYQ